MEYDDIVVGAGSTGAIIAARLSEEPDRRVLLLEAGHDYANVEDMPPEILQTHEPVIQGHNWKISAYIREENAFNLVKRASKSFIAASGDRLALAKTALKSSLSGNATLTQFDYPVGKVTGGSSTVNGTLALRGMPADYTEWAEAGNDAWSWDNVLSYFIKLENDHDVTGPYFGNQGPVPIERVQPEQFTTVQHDFFDICREMGFPEADHNYPDSTGVGGIPRNVHNNQRVSTATAYLATARKRSNLTILPNTLVNRVLMEKERAIGIEATVGDKPSKFLAKHITLSAGVIHSPAILLRSGIGSKIELERLGITPCHDLPGVGKNFIDHPAVAVWLIPKPGICHSGEDMHQVLLRYTAAQSAQPNDMQLYMLSSVNTSLFPELKTALGVPMTMALTAFLAKPFSKGRLGLVSADPRTPPRIYLNCATDPRDMSRLMEGVRLAWRVIQTAQLKDKIDRVFAWNAKIIESDQLLKETIGTFVRSSWHGVGTARMGTQSDPMAVVDQYGRVHGCDHLRVADASIMPTIPRAPTHFTCMMIGEMIADYMRN